MAQPDIEERWSIRTNLVNHDDNCVRLESLVAMDRLGDDALRRSGLDESVGPERPFSGVKYQRLAGRQHHDLLGLEPFDFEEPVHRATECIANRVPVGHGSAAVKAVPVAARPVIQNNCCATRRHAP